LSTQAHQQEMPQDAATGSWYHWDLLSGTAEGLQDTAGKAEPLQSSQLS
jgi:hypothetical protein